jgi:hypothetical protein
MHSIGDLKTRGVVRVEFEFSDFGVNCTVTCVNPNYRMNIITTDPEWKLFSSNDVEAIFKGPYSVLPPEMILAYLNIRLEVTQVEDEEEEDVGSEDDSEDEDVGSEEDSEDEDVGSEDEDDDW